MTCRNCNKTEFLFRFGRNKSSLVSRFYFLNLIFVLYFHILNLRLRVIYESTEFKSLLNCKSWIISMNMHLDYIIIINPATGVVEGVVDCSHLLPEKDVEDDTDVLNGIAYDQQAKRIFLTGKRWNKLFEVEIIKR